MNTLEKLQERMKDFVALRNWTAAHTPKHLVMSIAIEASELMEIFQWMTEKDALDRALHDSEVRASLKDEIADVMIYCLSLANVTKLDLKKVIEDKMDRNDTRFPPKHTLN
ncbi:MAG: nucleotide pyrophosphohydrolase [Candidatus Kariarchaeaceae archaeon]|jgi:NTP pyrophosphatase (non-canonical NTP hydrolase)